MTEDGMHGSDSPAEVESALFFYSKSIRFSTSNDVKTIDQIDLVPTISLLLGLPVPFSNLGFIIPEVFVDRDHLSLVNAARFNARQLDRYLTAYYETRSYIFRLTRSNAVGKSRVRNRFLEKVQYRFNECGSLGLTLNAILLLLVYNGHSYIRRKCQRIMMVKNDRRPPPVEGPGLSTSISI